MLGGMDKAAMRAVLAASSLLLVWLPKRWRMGARRRGLMRQCGIVDSGIPESRFEPERRAATNAAERANDNSYRRQPHLLVTAIACEFYSGPATDAAA